MSVQYIDPKVIEAIPLATQRMIPAQLPPPGITANFVNPSTCVPDIIGVNGVFLVIALFCYGVRIYTKGVISKTWTWDDLTITLGFALSIVLFGFVVNGTIHGAVGYHQWDVHIDRVINRAFTLQAYTGMVLSTPALGLIKSSLFIQYYALFGNLRWVRIAVWIGATFHCLAYGAASIAVLVMWTPRHGNSILASILMWQGTRFEFFVAVVIGAIGVTVDIFLFILPIPVVVRLKMSTSKKIAVLSVFATAGLAVIASCISMVYRLQIETLKVDTTWKLGMFTIFNQIEMFAGVIISSTPTVRRFFNHQTHHPSSLLAKLTSRSSHSGRSAPTKPNAAQAHGTPKLLKWTLPMRSDFQVWTVTKDAAEEGEGERDLLQSKERLSLQSSTVQSCGASERS